MFYRPYEKVKSLFPHDGNIQSRVLPLLQKGGSTVPSHLPGQRPVVLSHGAWLKQVPHFCWQFTPYRPFSHTGGHAVKKKKKKDCDQLGSIQSVHSDETCSWCVCKSVGTEERKKPFTLPQPGVEPVPLDKNQLDMKPICLT